MNKSFSTPSLLKVCELKDVHGGEERWNIVSFSNTFTLIGSADVASGGAKRGIDKSAEVRKRSHGNKNRPGSGTMGKNCTVKLLAYTYPKSSEGWVWTEWFIVMVMISLDSCLKFYSVMTTLWSPPSYHAQLTKTMDPLQQLGLEEISYAITQLFGQRNRWLESRGKGRKGSWGRSTFYHPCTLHLFSFLPQCELTVSLLLLKQFLHFPLDIGTFLLWVISQLLDSSNVVSIRRVPEPEPAGSYPMAVINGLRCRGSLHVPNVMSYLEYVYSQAYWRAGIINVIWRRE